jgi:hypothetical protein
MAVARIFGLGAGPDLTIGEAATPGLVMVGPPDMVGAGGRVLRVGVGQQFTTISAAVAASRDGDLILVNAGTYTNDFATITHKITIEGFGGMANLVATVPPPNSKGILTVDNDATIKNMSFSGAWISTSLGANAAGIRYEGGQLVLINDVFTGNQNGIMGNPVIVGLTVNTVTIDHSVFSGNGGGTGNTHNLYIGPVDRLTVTNSVFQNAVVGHELKSRALITDIQNSYFSDGPTGTASYAIDIPNGGVAVIKNNIIEKGPASVQQNMVHFGGEGIAYAGSSLTITGNTFVNDRGTATVAVLNHTAVSVDITGNQFVGIVAAKIAVGPATETNNRDANGVTFPDSTLVGALPGSTLVITDALDHTVVLSGSVQAVQGGSGHLTVSAVAGHIIAIGGMGGMDFTEVGESGGNQIVTKAGSVNRISVGGQDSMDSEGTDTIFTKSGNITGQVGGTATISDGMANNQWSVLGSAVITGHGGAPVVNVGAHGNLTMNGTVGYLEVRNNGGNAQIDIVQGGLRETLSVTGGAMDVKIYSGQMSITTASSAQGSTLRFGAGTVTLSSFGSDMIYAGSGAETIIVSSKATVYAGTGTMALYNHGNSGATFYGNGGRYLISGDGGGITYYGGALASTIDAQLSSITLIGGAGRLTVNGGSRETITGGAGGLTYIAGTGGANTITTLAGSFNQLTMGGANNVYSWGQDVIDGGAGNQNITVYGNSVVNGSTGNSKITLGGTDTLNGKGYDQVTVTTGAHAAINAGSLTVVQETNATVLYNIGSGLNAATAMITGSSTIQGGTGTALQVTTVAGMSTSIVMGDGAATIQARGSDIIHAGAGLETININAANTEIWGGSGALKVNNRDTNVGDGQIVHGGTGAVNIAANSGSLTFIGGSGTAVITAGTGGSLHLAGGSGSLTASGGTKATEFTAGLGATTLAMNTAGGHVVFGQGATTVQVAGSGAGVLFDFVSGAGGATDIIKGFRAGTDRLELLGGVGVQSQTIAGGAANLVLTDNTHVTLTGVTSTAHLFG